MTTLEPRKRLQVG